MANDSRPVGKQFREVYVEKGDPSGDSPAFRNRVYEYLPSDDGIRYSGLTSVLAREFGLTDTPRTEVLDAPIAIVLSLTGHCNSCGKSWGMEEGIAT